MIKACVRALLCRVPCFRAEPCWPEGPACQACHAGGGRMLGQGCGMCGYSAAGRPQTATRRVCAGRCGPGRRYMLGDRNSLRAYDLTSLLLHIGRRCRIRPNLRRCRNRGFQYLLQSCDIAGAAWTAPLPRPARALSQSCLKGSQLSGLQAPRSHTPSSSSSDGGADALRAAGHD